MSFEIHSLLAVFTASAAIVFSQVSSAAERVSSLYNSASSYRNSSIGDSAASDTLWYQAPFLLTVDNTPIDIADISQGGADGDDFGHAAPFLADLDGTGRRDLVVGSFSGRFRRYRNVGTPNFPAFDKHWTWLEGGGQIAEVPIYCCVAAGPQLVDIDGDGILDLSSGSYEPGAVYWWKGVGHGQFATRQLLTNQSGVPIFSDIRRLWSSLMSNIAWGNLYGSGRPDLVLGDGMGRIHILRNLGPNYPTSRGGIRGYTPIFSQPMFANPDSANEIRINGHRAFPDLGHAAPAVADWDGDGKLDILVGTEAGSVYWFRNVGTSTQPKFTTRQLLIPPGTGTEEWVEPGKVPPRGIRAQIQVVDINGDGLPDILVGDWAYTETPRTNLTRKERDTVQHLRAQLAALDKRHGFDRLNWRHKEEEYLQDTSALSQAQALQYQILPYLEPVPKAMGYVQVGRNLVPGERAHGRVWVFLNNGRERFTSGD